MELEVMLSGSKWMILEELARHPQSPLELSKAFNTTLANVSQQLRLLEAYGLVGKNKVSNHEKGKPRAIYSIKKEVNYVIKLGKNIAQRQILKHEPHNEFIMNVLTRTFKKDHYYLLKFFWENSNELLESSIGLFKNEEEAIELFIITEDIDFARKKFSKAQIASPQGPARNIVCWSHNSFEIDEGLKKKDTHFLELIKESTILLDNDGKLEKYKEDVGE